MLVFLKRHWISIGLLLISMIIGGIAYLKEAPINIWRVEYEFATEDATKLPAIAQGDTVFQYKTFICRNYSGSISDTLRNENIRRHDLKMYLKTTSEKEALSFSESVLKSKYITIYSVRFKEQQHRKRVILYWVVFGLFLIIVSEFIRSLKKKPGTE